MIDFTVVIPTYNGASRVPDVLEKLRSQTGTENINWEIIVVDNNSSDETANVIQDMIVSWQEVVPLQYVFEAQQGIAFARQQGVEFAQGEFIGFLDDDNFPYSDWVLQSYLFGKQSSKVGAYGGQNHPIYQVDPPLNFKRIQSFLAIRESGEEPFLFCPEKLQLPAGAGLVVRKKAWLDHIPHKLFNIKRGGNDYEISLNLYKAGWEIWYNPKMHLDHYIPSSRLDKNYLLSLAHLYGLKCCQLRMLITPVWKKPIVLLRIMLGGFKRYIKHQLQYKHQIETDIVASCELEFFRATIISPFYFLKQKIYRERNSSFQKEQ
jgi:glycosyltransferase involved in cell wall biosynthesis